MKENVCLLVLLAESGITVVLVSVRDHLLSLYVRYDSTLTFFCVLVVSERFIFAFHFVKGLFRGEKGDRLILIIAFLFIVTLYRVIYFLEFHLLISPDITL